MSRTPSQRGRYAKQRGSSFELDISHQLFDELGIHFRRNLEQVRTAGLGDLLPDSNLFPFSLELGSHLSIRPQKAPVRRGFRRHRRKRNGQQKYKPSRQGRHQLPAFLQVGERNHGMESRQ